MKILLDVLRRKPEVVRRPKKPARVYHYTRRGAEETIARMRSPTGIIMEGHLLRVFREQGYDVEPVRDNKSVYDPESLFSALDKYVEAPCQYEEEILGQAIGLALKTFGHSPSRKKLKPITFDYELMEAVKMDKASGAPHFARKGDVFASDKARSERIAAGLTAPPPCVAYHRVQHGPEGPKTRLVWGYPLSMTLLEARFARPLIREYLAVKTPMTFGLVKNEVGCRVMEVMKHGVAYGLDFSKFDSSVPTRLVHTAFEILATHFDMSDADKEVWRVVKDYFLNTLILMPDGYVYQKHCGVPSGSYFTQLVDSIVNYIVIQYMALVVTGTSVNNRVINVLGDDSLFALSGWYEIEVFAQIAKQLGMSVNVSKSGRYRQREAPSFLGHKWISGIPDRPALEVVQRMIFPERPSPRGRTLALQKSRVEERVMAYVGDSACAWGIAYNSGVMGKSNDVSAFQLQGRRTGFPITGAEEIMSLMGEGLPTVAKTLYLGLIR